MERCSILNRLFLIHCSEKEISRLEKENSLLLDLTNQMYKRAAAFFRMLIAIPKEESSNGYGIEGTLFPELDLHYSTLCLKDDDYYNSDFTRMAHILQVTDKYLLDLATVRPQCYPLTEFTPSMTDEELGCVNVLDDGTNWAEGPLDNPKLKHITCCYALNALCSQTNFSIPDVVRINKFSIEVKLAFKQRSDQEHIPLGYWWDRMDLSKFKGMILDSVASRPKGQTLEAALLQICRMLFKDYADEALTKVGISDIDCYLEALKTIINHPYEG